MLAIQISTTDHPGSASDRISFFRTNSLIFGTTDSVAGGGNRLGQQPSCDYSHNGGFCSVYIVDKTGKGFEIYKTFGSIEEDSTVPLGVQDLQHDGNPEVVVNQRFASIFKQCVASWPAIYAWTGDGYMNVSDRFKNFYRGQLDKLNKLISTCRRADLRSIRGTRNVCRRRARSSKDC